MIIFLQFPITDIRRFLPVDTGMLVKPVWPAPGEEQYLRYFGLIRRRGKGGVQGWVGENKICDGHNAIKLNLNIPPFQSSGGKVRLKCASRHFFFDGRAVGKYETVLVTEPLNVNFRRDEFEAFIKYINNIPAQIHFPYNHTAQDNLFAMRRHLARLYLYASSKSARMGELSRSNWVLAGEPLVFCELSPDDHVLLPNGTRRTIDLLAQSGLCLSRLEVKKDNQRWHTLVLERADNSGKTRNTGRLLRITLMRLHAEFESIRKIAAEIEGRTIVPQRSTPESDNLQRYLSDTTGKINRAIRKTQKFAGVEEIEASEFALSMMDAFDPGERDALIAMLRQYEVRPQVINNVQNLLVSGAPVQVETVNQIEHIETVERVDQMTVTNTYQPQPWEKIVVYVAALLFIGLISFLVIRNEPIADPNFVVFIRVILSVLTASMGATIPGMLNVGINRKGLAIRAGGALALFVLTFLFTPTVIR